VGGVKRAARVAAVALAVSACLIAAGCGRRSRANEGAADKTASAGAIQQLDDSLADLTPAAAPTIAATAAVAGRATCAEPMPHGAGDEDATMQSGGIERTYILHVPPSYDGTHRTPLVLNFHGFGSNARQEAIYSGLPAKGDAAGFIVVTPDGTGTPQRWNLLPAGGVDDVAFARDLLDRVEAQLCVDTQRVFAAGISNGSAFSLRLACEMPDRIAAVAAVAAMYLPLRCSSARTVGVIAFHGTADPCVPFEGGTSQCGMGLPVPKVETAAADWAKHDGCNATPAQTSISAHVRTLAYSECSNDAAVVLYVIDGGGHTWPGSIDVARLGATTHEIYATDEIWDFFQAQGARPR
jgi:polyhydroxybutyrate depolymerase